MFCGTVQTVVYHSLFLHVDEHNDMNKIIYSEEETSRWSWERDQLGEKIYDE